MKKFLILFATLFILTGCANINNLNNDDIVDTVLKEPNHKTNTNLEGYKLYLPLHMTLIGDLNGNDVLYSYKDKYYLYVDLISYYNKKENKYNVDASDYEYSKELSYNDLGGYVVVSRSKGGYLVETMYNYAKIEVVTNDVKRAITNSLVVLKNIKYNYKVIDSMIGSNVLVYDSELFELMGPKKKGDNFLEYVKEYGDYDEKDAKTDEDVLDINTTD